MRAWAHPRLADLPGAACDSERCPRERPVRRPSRGAAGRRHELVGGGVVSNRPRKSTTPRRPRIECDDCNSTLHRLPTGPTEWFLAHDETCPYWRAREAATRRVVGEDPIVLGLRV